MSHLGRPLGFGLLSFWMLLGWGLSSLGCSTSFTEDPSEMSSSWQISAGHVTSESSSQEGEWSATGSMAAARLRHSAVRLPDGRILAVGGYNRSVELYSPLTGTWSPGAGALNTHRGATITLLPSGRVLLAGVGAPEWNSGISTEEYDSASGQWAAKGNMGTPRLFHTATLLQDGHVLVTGGATSEYGGSVLASAEVYDSTTGSWSPVPSMAVARRNHTATLLSTGQVLVTGGRDASGKLLKSAEVYDFTTGTWSQVASMAVARADHTATRLSNGKVLVAGGGDSDWSSSASAELFGPVSGSWQSTSSMARPRRSHSATLLSSGLVLLAGGFHEYTGILSFAEVYDPNLGTWRSAGNLSTGRYSHSATLMTGGRVLVAGGFSNGDQASAEVYAPPAGVPAPEQPTEPAGTSVLLEVTDTEGHPIPAAIISSQGAVLPLDSSGHRLFENLPPGRFLARVDALGFTSATAVLDLQAGAHVGTRVQLLPLGPPLIFQAEQGGTLQTQNVRVTIPPNSVVDALGQPVSGLVSVTLAPLDPTSQLSAMPGPLEGLPTWGPQRVQLESLFMAEVSLWSSGAPAQLAWGASATLEFILPPALSSQLKAGDTVPAWSFDLDAGFWREEGSGTLRPSQAQTDRLAWVVQVSHFTWWNSDFPWTDKSCVNVQVVDALGVPVSGAPVSAEGVSYTGISYPQYTNASGQTCIEIKRGHTANVFAGLFGQPTTGMVTVPGTQAAAVCGTGPCIPVNLTLAGVICRPGTYQKCPYTGQPPSTEGQGICRAGVRQCNVAGTQWSDCQGEVLPAITGEDCQTPFDDDCDGDLHNGCKCSQETGVHCYTGHPSGTEGVGICHGGTWGCGMYGTTCLGEKKPKPSDACSTSDDEDCDGVSEPCPPWASGWASTNSMASARAYHSATRLSNGNVLVAGGQAGPGNYLATAKVYSPASGAWSATGSMLTPRSGHTATLLPDGKVLVAGGFGSSGLPVTAEVYDPASGTWSATGSMLTPRYAHTATLLPNGKVLVAGGFGHSGILITAEVYDPASGTWSATGSMLTPRHYHTATLLPNGTVLVAGGFDNNGAVEMADLYNPASGTWSATSPLPTPLGLHTATLLPNGKVLVAGGSGTTGAELYDPAAGTWSNTDGMSTLRVSHTATLLPNGNVLVVGGNGYGGSLNYLATAEVYSPASGTWSTTNSMLTPRSHHTATLLPNGKVLVAGGDGPSGYLATAEVYTR